MKDRIRAVRQDKGLTQAQFAQQLGVKRNTVAMYESGGRTPTNALLTSICRTYRVNPEWLHTGEGQMYEQADQLLDVSSFGPAGLALMSVAARLYEALGEENTLEFLRSVSSTVPAALPNEE